MWGVRLLLAIVGQYQIFFFFVVESILEVLLLLVVQDIFSSWRCWEYIEICAVVRVKCNMPL